MKKDSILQFLGSCVIAVAIVVAGALIANKMPQTPLFPANLNVTTSDGSTEFGDYMSAYDAAAYLCIDTDSLMELIRSGKLDGVFYRVDDSYIISKQALQEWMDHQIGTSR